MTTTIVTALFDIKREEYDGRSFSTYLNWFKQTLSVNCPMVVYVESNLIDFVLQARQNKETQIIPTDLHSLKLYQYKSIMDKILLSSEYKNKIADPSRIECQSSLYTILQYSKFNWMAETSEKNIFHSSYFLWMDAGLSRFFGNLNVTEEYPSSKMQLELGLDNDKVLIQAFMSHYPELYYANTLTDGYFLDNRSFIMGGMFGGTQLSLKKLENLILNQFELLLKNNVVNNEQIMLGYLLKQYPELFKVFINNSSHHRNYELIDFLSQN